ncbi:MAG: 30S ribosomal protein S12 methylthiotransferase RimO [Parasporobacterium sp.]|nr:30S ribosomal protein S12 methylthiotransferase RimO [Parasporobacterium sp.]
MTIYFISLGCDKNLVDSEEMLGLLNESGYSFVDSAEDADVIVVNTCAFINDAKEESINSIIEMGGYKKAGSCKALIVTGCLAERYKDEFEKLLPEVDAIVGTNSFTSIVDAIQSCLNSENKTLHKYFNSLDFIERYDDNQVVTTGGYYAYLKIAEGCSKHCTYCAIPFIRGDYRSVPFEKVIKRAEALANKGVKELILVAQESTMYGTDLYGKKELAHLLEEISKIEGIEWIRLLYSYPEEINDELIQEIKNNKKVCHYIDMPIQHSSDDILKKMGRRTSNAELVDIIGKLRKEIPDIVLRTSIIVGFPGESEDDFNNLLEFVKKMKFERLGAFSYSQEEDTAAATFPKQIDDEVKAERFDKLMSLQQEISSDYLKSLIGKTLKVMVEGKLVDEDVYIGRSYMDAPGVDGNVFINCESDLMSGDFVDVLITGSSEYDLIGDLVVERF